MRRVLWLVLAGVLACGPHFYEAPPPLGAYPERLPRKDWADLFLERSPRDPGLPGAEALDEECRQLPGRLVELSVAERVVEVDRLLKVNREGFYEVGRANFLHELRELAVVPEGIERAMAYLGVRPELMKSLPAKPPAQRPWHLTPEQFEEAEELYEALSGKRDRMLAEGLAGADEFLKAYWLVRKAMDRFQRQEFAVAAEVFGEVVEGFSEHPRAEVARLMMARCGIEESRVLERRAARGKDLDGFDPMLGEAAERLEEAEAGLVEFIKRYPRGRFTPDAHGWLGAVAFDRKEYGGVVKHQIARYELQPTREILRTLLRECEQAFLAMVEAGGGMNGDELRWLSEREFPAAAMARQPLVARLYVQCVLDPLAREELSESGDRRQIDFLRQRVFLPKPFVVATLGLLGAEMLKVRVESDETLLTLLAWAASEGGEHGQAVALMDRVVAKVPRDETLHARAIVLQRSGRHAEAVVAFEALKAAWPESPLALDLEHRKGLSLFYSGRQGEAFLAFSEREERWRQERLKDPQVAWEMPLHSPSFERQWQDTVLQFAPLAELEKALGLLDDEDGRRGLVRAVLVGRALAARDISMVRRHVGGIGEVELGGWSFDNYWRIFRLEDWERDVESIAVMYDELAAGLPESEVSRVHLALARQWQALRGRLTLPSLGATSYAESEGEKQELLRRTNAVALGYPMDAVNRELDSRDELTQVIEHASVAAESDDPAVAAAALELANEALFRRAEFSRYQNVRAVESDASGLSAKLVGRLRRQFPQSAEAGRAARFLFGPVAGEWMPGDYNPWRTSELMGAVMTGREFDSWEEDPEEKAAYQGIEAQRARFDALQPGATVGSLQRDLSTARAEVQRLRAKTDPSHQHEVLAAIARLDTIAAVLAVPGVRVEDVSNYLNDRKGQLPVAFASVIEFERRLRPVLGADGQEMPSPMDSIAGWREFLVAYPESPRAEAASFRMVRMIARQQRSRVAIEAFRFPEAPILGGYKRVGVLLGDSRGEPAQVLAALDEHDVLFPGARYRDDVDLS